MKLKVSAEEIEFAGQLFVEKVAEIRAMEAEFGL
jgi:hypothetical protein